MLANFEKRGNGVHTLWDESVKFAQRRAQRLLKESGISGPPFLPEHLAPLQRVKRIVKEDLGNQSGLLLPLRDGFEIKVNATHSPQRQNFSCAHEIAHTFFLEEEGKAVVERLRKGNGRPNNWEEHLCDVAASELLMPNRLFSRYASHYNFGVRSLIPLSQLFNTSVVPTALRLCDVNPRYCYVVHWARENSDEIDELKLRATWLTWSRKRITSKTGRFVFKPRLFNRGTSIADAYMSGRPTYSKEWIGVGNFRGECQIWSQGFTSGSNRFVISLIFPQHEN